MFLMVECVKEELQAMKDGLNDIIPSELLSGLTAEVCIPLVLQDHSHNICEYLNGDYFMWIHMSATYVCGLASKCKSSYSQILVMHTNKH